MGGWPSPRSCSRRLRLPPLPNAGGREQTAAREGLRAARRCGIILRYRGPILLLRGSSLNRSRISASLVVSGVLVLSACGASKPSQATAPSSTSPAASPTAASPTAASPTAASTRIGPYTQIFATPLPANPAQAKVIQGFEMAE